MPDKLYAILETNQGDITCQLYSRAAPKTVANFVLLAKGEKEWTDPRTHKQSKEPLYNGTIFHRVIPDFMIQGGDPLGLGIGGPGYKFEDEFVDELTFSEAGILAMANSGPGTNGSQFFITVVPTDWLNGRHTIFGKVMAGQEVVEAISKVKTGANDKPQDPVVLKKVTIKEAI
ncbi:cyclophilin [candidate division WOR-1 bacterium RIFCSPLOWO2_02_FULL_46_20]|uniref:Peptidyl-prolyl cis-trans isomerase n=2 Tax=Saganbacteria TaxID=1703751 RepID=A0A1F4RDF5_UNCSA|nr:MAG: cyclophilin [candidate division WOR-1 bacterium RIFCSPHIGHO2_02_FULL_45_12]OGC06224.1 MAG: cyclophilin [candidate division WOR-1 bacterium RIFCSPLOWO2_02_FULL_46_20]OGC10032.1 MAG: cyclophilin [candidate division WOR-1 bacterium RIFCSPLOWO2_12_FULL_45_9]